MNRLENLLKIFGKKMAEVSALCPDIITYAGVEKAFEALITTVSILRKPEAKMNRHTAEFVSAEAEQAVVKLSKCKRRFLVTLGTFQGLKARIARLRPEAYEPLGEKIWFAVKTFELLRTNQAKVETDELLKAYLGADAVIKTAESHSETLSLADVVARIGETQKSAVVGSIRPARRGRSADKRLADAQRRLSMKGTTNGGGKNRQHTA
jgi:hypothetical protein